MINREATIRWKGYDPADLKPRSMKKVWANCDNCGKGRWVTRDSYRDLCKPCSKIGNKNPMFGKKRPDLTIRNIKNNPSKNRNQSGKNNPMYGIIGKNHPRYGVKHTEESIRMMSKNSIGKNIGENNHNWKGGITPENKMFRESSKYAEWRILVFERDNYTCQECDSRGGNLNAHHILPYRDWKEPRFSLNIKNGITLCEECHRKTFANEYEFFNKYFDIANGVGM